MSFLGALLNFFQQAGEVPVAADSAVFESGTTGCRCMTVQKSGVDMLSMQSRENSAVSAVVCVIADQIEGGWMLRHGRSCGRFPHDIADDEMFGWRSFRGRIVRPPAGIVASGGSRNAQTEFFGAVGIGESASRGVADGSAPFQNPERLECHVADIVWLEFFVGDTVRFRADRAFSIFQVAAVIKKIVCAYEFVGDVFHTFAFSGQVHCFLSLACYL